MMSLQNQMSDITLELKEILGFEDLEAQVYVNLLRMGPITASALSKELDIDRARMYRTIDKMTSRNIVSTTLTSPKLCIATNPKDVINITLKKKEDEINRIKNSGKTIIEKITKDFISKEFTSVPTFRVVQGRNNIYADIEQMIEKSSGIVYIATSVEDISRMYHSEIPEKIKICQKNGGEVRLIVEINDTNLIPFVTRFEATETKICKLPSKGRMVVQKDNQMIMSDSSISNRINSNSESDFSLCTNSIEMVNNIHSLCDLLWHTSQSLKKIKVTSSTKNSKT